jgi:putative addiction module killer protein
MEIRRTQLFEDWLFSLHDREARSRIADRLDRLATGHPGKFRSVGDGVLELKLDFGPGYRIYYVQRGSVFVVLLCGGDKSTQSKDIDRAKKLVAQVT